MRRVFEVVWRGTTVLGLATASYYVKGRSLGMSYLEVLATVGVIIAFALAYKLVSARLHRE